MYFQKTAKQAKTADRENKRGTYNKRNKPDNYWHTLINECFFCLLLPWTVGQMCLTKCSPPKYLQNRTLEHIALFTRYEATVCACPLPRPPTHTFYLFSVHNVTWPRIYLCFSLSPASLKRACWSCVSTVWCPCLRRFLFLRGYYTMLIISDLMLATTGTAHCLKWMF